jgi:hypothetical protein
LVSHEEGRTLQLISADEIRPLRGGVFTPDAITAIATKYRFQKYPTSPEPETRRYEIGVAVIDGITIPINNLEIYADGFLVSTNNTDDSDLVLGDLLEWGMQIGLRRPTTIVPPKYVSRIVVDFEKRIDVLAEVFGILSQAASEAFVDRPDNLNIINIQVGPFPPTQYPYQTTWQLARRTTDPIAPLRYISSAPLSSDAHFAFLETVERRLSGN